MTFSRFVGAVAVEDDAADDVATASMLGLSLYVTDEARMIGFNGFMSLTII